MAKKYHVETGEYGDHLCEADGSWVVSGLFGFREQPKSWGVLDANKDVVAWIFDLGE